MKSLLLFLPAHFLTYVLIAQVGDTTKTEKSITFSSPEFLKKTDGQQQNTSLYHSEKQKQIVVKGNIAFTTYNLQLSPVENEIADLEALECNALLKRDTAVLKKIWTRDFTLDDQLNELVNGQSILPYYSSYSRMVEKCTVMENLVYTSGFEYVQTLKLHENLKDPIKRNYSHTWVRRYGVWKLSTKTHN